jgi:hypothetical protein
MACGLLNTFVVISYGDSSVLYRAGVCEMARSSLVLSPLIGNNSADFKMVKTITLRDPPSFVSLS